MDNHESFTGRQWEKKHILNPFLRRGTWILWPLFPFRYYVIADTWRLEQEALTFLSELITAAWQPLCKTIQRTTQQHMYGNARVQYVSDDVDVAGPNSAFRNRWCQFKVCFLMNPRCLLCTLVRFIKTEEFLFFPVDLFGVFRDFWHSKLKTTASNPPDLTLKCSTTFQIKTWPFLFDVGKLKRDWKVLTEPRFGTAFSELYFAHASTSKHPKKKIL